MSQQDNKPQSPDACPSRWRLRMDRRIIQFLLVALLIWPFVGLIIYAEHDLQDAIDPMEFPEISKPLLAGIEHALEKGEMSEADKADLIIQATVSQLQRELRSTFGWTVNDLLLSPTQLLNGRTSRQQGVIFATRMLVQFISPHLTKLGATDKENPITKEVRERYIVYGEDIWGFFRMSSERAYKTSINKLLEYSAAVRANEATYNFRTDDMYNLLEFILSEQFTGQAMGLLTEPNEDVTYGELNDRLYYVQGMCLVIRDMLHALNAAYPDQVAKAGQENIDAAFTALDRVATFYPIIVMRGRHDSILADHRGKMARYMVTIQTRIGDIAQAVSR